MLMIIDENDANLYKKKKNRFCRSDVSHPINKCQMIFTTNGHQSKRSNSNVFKCQKHMVVTKKKIMIYFFRSI